MHRGVLDDPLFERLRRALAPEFQLESRIAAGGMGIVYLAREVALDRRVAVKVLRPELATAIARERFLREARLLARLQHPNIVPVHRADERDGLPYYVMDFVEGSTLADRIAAGPLSEMELSRVANDLLIGLAAAHAAGIIHRDVKPSNIFLVEGRALLGDFGISSDTDTDEPDLTDSGFAVGTRQYMAPEQLTGRSASERSDQYSAAVALYEAATGRSWEPMDDPAKANWRGVPTPMIRVLRRGLATTPTDRWGSAREMQRALAKAWRRPTRRRVIAVVAIIAAVLLGSQIERWRPPPMPRRELAILPFSVVGRPQDSLGPAVAIDADVNLAWFPGISSSSVPFERAAEWVKAHPREDAGAAARALDAHRAISGSIERRGDSLHLRLIVTEPGLPSSILPACCSVAAAEAGDLGRLAAIAIGTQMGARPGTNITNLASRSPEAIGKFMEGEALFERDAWHLAARSYQEAVELDSAFVLARWRLLLTRLWAREYSWEAADSLTTCCADRLPPLEEGLARAMSDTNLVRRFARFDSLVGRFGNTGSLPLMFASDLFHRGPLVGRGVEVSLKRFEEAISADSGGTPAPAYDHMVWGKSRLGEQQEEKEWLTARKSLGTAGPSEPNITDFLQLGYDLRWRPMRARLTLWLLDHFGSENDLSQLARFYRFSASWDLPEGQSGVGAIYASRLKTAYRESGLEAQGLARLTWGQPAAGLALIDSAARYFRTDEAELQRHQWRLLLPLIGAGETDKTEEAEARDWLEARSADARFAARAEWTLALDAIRRDDTAAATSSLDRLAALGATDSAAARLARLATAIRTSDRDPRGALAATESLRSTDSPAPGNDIFSRSLLHLYRARWQEAAGSLEGALGEILWYENSDAYHFPTLEAQKMEVDAVASVGARVTRARLLLKSGQHGEACPMLTRVRQLWRHADPSLAARVTEADSLLRAECQ